ncbi:MAG: OmpA family protein [Pirellulales bacterium]|nr:OmpA family protein [Pirellulales bacterium]
MAVEQEDQAAGVPEWVVTFGDMMSLLLTFFIMLVSMSEMKEEERYQAMVESMREQFGYEASILSFTPGEQKPRNSNMQYIASLGRARRRDTLQGGDKVKAPVGENARVQIIRTGKNSTAGGVIYFDRFEIDLTEKHKQQLQHVVQQIAGKPQRVEVRGYSISQPVPEESGFRDNWDLAFQRARVVEQYLISQGISNNRISINVFGPNDPVYTGIDPTELLRNARVQVIMVDERSDGNDG